MLVLAPPRSRCGQCGGCFDRRTLQAEEHPTVARTCMMCGWDEEVIGGEWVAVTRQATPTTLAEMRAERRAVAVQTTQQRKATAKRRQSA